MPNVEGDKLTKKKFKSYPIGYIHIDIAEVQTAERELCISTSIARADLLSFRSSAARTHLADFVSAYNFGRRLKNGLTAYEFICKICTKEPEQFRLDPIHHSGV